VGGFAIGAAAVAVLALLYQRWQPHVPQQPPPAFTTAASRMAATSTAEAEVANSCLEVQMLWGANLSCADFLHNHWETAPLVSHPGNEWRQQIMNLSDVTTMITMWPIKFRKNHGTALMQHPDSGFVADDREGWRYGDLVPDDAIELALREQRTLVIHNLEVYWPPLSRFIKQVVRFFHCYTQVNLYLSPGGLPVATAPHQDAHSVFIIQLYGSKQWSVYAPTTPLTLKGKQRGKHGDKISPGDPRLMGPRLVHTKLTPGSVLYIPRAFYHNTATLDNDLSAALTVSITTEDVFNTWLFLVGEAVQQLQRHAHLRADAERLAAAMRRQAALEPGGSLGADLREALPRALLGLGTEGPTFADGGSEPGWREHVLRMLRRSLAAEGAAPAAWLTAESEDALRLYTELDDVLARKRVPAALKLKQIERLLAEMAGRPLRGAQVDVDIDAIFKTEKQDKSYIPSHPDKIWFPHRVKDW